MGRQNSNQLADDSATGAALEQQIEKFGSGLTEIAEELSEKPYIDLLNHLEQLAVDLKDSTIVVTKLSHQMLPTLPERCSDARNECDFPLIGFLTVLHVSTKSQLNLRGKVVWRTVRTGRAAVRLLKIGLLVRALPCLPPEQRLTLCSHHQLNHHSA
jgi:hypothetical protein